MQLRLSKFDSTQLSDRRSLQARRSERSTCHASLYVHPARRSFRPFGLLLRDSNTGGLEVYDIANNQITNAAFIGTVGIDWQFSGVGNFSGNPGETDLLLRNSNTGGLEVYDIANNQLTGAAFIGTVGLDWQFAGIAPIHAAGASDLVLHNVNSGAFEVYDIAGNTLVGAASLGAVGLDWQIGGFAVDPPTASTA